MKKLLALSIALLSLNLYGAEISKTGLEGWGKKEGVTIRVRNYSKLDKTFDVKAIKNQVELKLRLAGIKVEEKVVKDSISINMSPIILGDRILGYHINVRPLRVMTFKFNGKEYESSNSSMWLFSGTAPPSPRERRQALDEILDTVLLKYLQANPKK